MKPALFSVLCEIKEKTGKTAASSGPGDPPSPQVGLDLLVGLTS